MLRIGIFSEIYRKTVRGWQNSAWQMFLQARHDYLTGGKASILRYLIDKEMDELPVARDWWMDSEVIRIGNVVKELHDSACGWQRFDLSVLILEGRPDLRIIV